MRIPTPVYDVGDTVTYSNFGDDEVTGIIIGRHENIKNGRPGFDLDNQCWGYDDQIVRVVRRNA